MQKSHVVDASQVCIELDALCVNIELHHENIGSQNEDSAHRHARCLFQLLGVNPDVIAAASGRSLTTTYLRELWHSGPWRIEMQFGDGSCPFSF